ncbi:hypothetical protein SORBI_3007G099700 [Sorghum bicolor]|uniref:Uncharacterized protein n=1 Tax=Sorghum bicolor TaxID=4558 RepID=A0A1B6PGW4_SORBI|nr:hypothetical protein SORBI_3007G099700 [Sorghum bicolor]
MEPAIDMKMRVIGATVITDGIEMPLDKADKSVLGTDSEAVSTKEPTTKVCHGST